MRQQQPKGPTQRTALFLWLLLGAASVVALAGCSDRPRSESHRMVGRPLLGDQRLQELFDRAINNLQRLEQFSTTGEYSQIRANLSQLARTEAASALPDPLELTCPQPEMLRQIVNRLNRWAQSQAPPAWQLDPLVETLPAELRQLPSMQMLDQLEFLAYDGFVLREAVWLREAARWARGKELDDLQRAKQLFDWTIRNIQLELDTPQRVPLFPWEALLLGRGTAWERARVFILLARQQQLDVVVLGLERSQGAQPELLQPWVAVLAGDDLYLFDPALGLPLPARDGVKTTDHASLDIQPVTLAELLADPTLLKQLDFEPGEPYLNTPSGLGHLVVLIEASPSSLSKRMKLIQSRLDPRQQLALTTSPKAVANRVSRCLGKLKTTADIRLWPHPFATRSRRRQLDLQAVRRRLEAMLPFYASAVQEPSRSPSPGAAIADSSDDSVAYQTLSDVIPPPPPSAPLLQGRILYLKGVFHGEPGAIGCLTRSRKPDQQLAKEAALWTAFYKQRYLWANQQLPPDQQRPPKQLEALAEQQARLESAFARLAKQDASYWLGLIHFELGLLEADTAAYERAVRFLTEKTLDAFPGGTWQSGARYHLARIYEALGQPQKAIEYYLANRATPEYHGCLVRARWLQPAQPKTTGSHPLEDTGRPPPD